MKTGPRGRGKMKPGAPILFVIICLHFGAHPAVAEVKNIKTFLGLSEDNIQINGGKENLRRLVRSPKVSDPDNGSDEDNKDSIGASDPAAAGDSKKAGPGELYLPKGYNKLEIPKGKAYGMEVLDEIEVTLGLNIRSIVEINEENYEVEFEMDAIVEWRDGELLKATIFEGEDDDSDEAVDEAQKVLDPSFLKRIWKPDIFIENLVSVEQPDLMGKPARLQFAPKGGLITYTTRVKVKIECDFDFEYYPADTQKCDVVFRSYSHNSTTLKLTWHPPIGVYFRLPEDDNFDVGVGSLRRYQLITHPDLDPSTNETFDCLQFTFLARRRLSYHLVQTYIPSMLYIGITWLCFMVPRRMIEARIAIVMTTLLTLTAMFASVRESTPIVSYTKAIDLWMVACIAFVFLVLLEFSVLLWTESQQNDKQEKQEQKEQKEEREVTEDLLKDRERDHVVQQNPTLGQRIRAKFLEKSIAAIDFIETYSFVLILCVLTFLNVFYWCWLLISSGYYKWKVDATHNGINLAEKEIKELTDLFGRLF